MFVEIPEKGYWLGADSICRVEEKYGAKYMGYWCTKRPSGGWNEQPVDVFYQPNPDSDKGHTHYFGMLYRGDVLYITEASTAFCEPIAGIPTDDGEVIVSRYRHNYVEKDGRMIDGGRDYTRTSGHSTVTVAVNGDQFVITEREHSE